MPTFQFGSDDIHNMEARIAELTAEVARLRETLMQIANGYVVETYSVQCIARNALKEGS